MVNNDGLFNDYSSGVPRVLIYMDHILLHGCSSADTEASRNQAGCFLVGLRDSEHLKPLPEKQFRRARKDMDTGKGTFIDGCPFRRVIRVILVRMNF